MIERHIRGRDHPMTSEDLAICRRVLDAVMAEFQLDQDGEEAAHIAAVIIELFREGVHNFDHLKVLAFAAKS